MSISNENKAPLYFAMALGLSGIIAPNAYATDFTAAVVMEKLEPSARVPYISGVIEGLAYARYERDNEHLEGDNKTVAGMNCIYDWFYEKPHTIDLIYLAFGKYPSYPPGVIIGNLVKQACGA